MDAWIIADTGQLAVRIRESLVHLAVDCAASRVVPVQSIGTQTDTMAGFDGLVFFAVRRLESSHFEVLRQIRSVANNDAKLVVISSIGDHGNVLNAIRAGAGDFLSADESLHEELASFVGRIKSERKRRLVNGNVISVVPCHAASDASLMAVNLAGVIAKRAGACGLLDFHLRGGDLSLLLKLSPRHTMIDLLKQQGTIDEAVFQQALTPHESGIRLLAGPKAFIDWSNVRPQLCQQIIGLAQRSHPYVIVNSEDVQHPEQVRALAGSDDIVLTMRLDVVSLHRAKQHIEFMTRNRVPREHIHVVALGVGHACELPVGAVKKVLQISFLHRVPDDPESILRSVNVGNPVVFEIPHAKISQAMTAFVDSLIRQSCATAAPSSPRSPMSALKQAAAVALHTLSLANR